MSTWNGPSSFPDTTQSTSSSTGAIKVSGGLAVGKTLQTDEGLSLPNGGSKLDSFHYNYGVSMSFQGSVTVSSLWVFTRVGDQVVVQIQMVNGTPNGTGGGIFATGGQIPSQFRPASTCNFQVIVQESGTVPAAPGLLTVDTSGNVALYKTLQGGGFATTGFAQGMSYAFSATWQAS